MSNNNITKVINEIEEVISSNTSNTKTYTIVVKEILERRIEVESDSEEEAIEKVSKMYCNEEIVLGSEDFIEHFVYDRTPIPVDFIDK